MEHEVFICSIIYYISIVVPVHKIFTQYCPEPEMKIRMKVSFNKGILVTMNSNLYNFQIKLRVLNFKIEYYTCCIYYNVHQVFAY